MWIPGLRSTYIKITMELFHCNCIQQQTNREKGFAEKKFVVGWAIIGQKIGRLTHCRCSLPAHTVPFFSASLVIPRHSHPSPGFFIRASPRCNGRHCAIGLKRIKRRDYFHPGDGEAPSRNGRKGEIHNYNRQRVESSAP